MKILILTTAINRPELHLKSFSKYKKIIKKDWDVQWFINVDYIKELKSSVVDTRSNIREIFSDYPNIKFKFFLNNTSNLNLAVRKLVYNAKPILKDFDVIFYLEDDWSFKKNIPDIEKILVENFGKDFKEERFIVGMGDRIFYTNIYPNFQPQLWSRSTFKALISVFGSVRNINVSPELILQDNYYSFINEKTIKKMKYKYFFDIGRNWMIRKGIKKRNKKSKNYSSENSTYLMYKNYNDYIKKIKIKDTGWDVTKFTMDVNGEKLNFDLPANYNDLVKGIKEDFLNRVEIGDIKVDSSGILTKINNPLESESVVKLGDYFAGQLSDKLYGSECFVTYVHPYINNIIERENASWLWHYDDVAPGLIKILVYLTPTTKDTGAFLVLKNEEDKHILMTPSSISPTQRRPVSFSKTRIKPKDIQKYKSEGYKEYFVEGDEGTFIVFNNNILHKATIPKKEPRRMCIIYHFRPFYKKLPKRIDPNITGDWRGNSHIKSKNYEYFKL